MTKPSETSRHLRVNGVDLSYIEQGSGDPVVFVHGAISDHRYWEPQRQAVGERHRFIAYTYRYHGTGPWPDDGRHYSAANHAADLEAFVRGLNAGPVHLVGLSFGGFLATLVASDHPDLVRSLSLVEPGTSALLAEVPEGKPLLEDRGNMLALASAEAKAGKAAHAGGLFFDWVTNQGAGGFDKQPEALRQMVLDNARTLPVFVAAPPPPQVSCATLGDVKAPTIVVGGEQTRRYYSLINEIIVRCIPGSRSVIIPKATHLSSYQNPSAFNEAILQFLGQHEKG